MSRTLELLPILQRIQFMYNFYINPNAKMVLDMPGYFIHPEYPGYAINRNGEIWSFKTNRFLTPWIHPVKGRRRVALRDINGQRRELFLYRLLGELFVPLPARFNGDFSQATINHIDHNKLNDSIENLEWCTREENVRDAWVSGCCENAGASQRRPCFCIDIYTRNYVEAVSSGKMDMIFNWPSSTTRKSIFRQRGTAVVHGRYIVDYLDDPKWLGVDVKANMELLINDYLLKASYKSPKLLTDIETGETIQFDSMKELTDFLNCSDRGIRYSMDNNTLFHGRYKIENLSDVMNEYYMSYIE